MTKENLEILLKEVRVGSCLSFIIHNPAPPQWDLNLVLLFLKGIQKGYKPETQQA